MKLTKGQRVGVKIFDHDDAGKPKPTPPKFFGEVIEAADDGESGYVKVDGSDEDNARTFFHASELEPEKKK